MNVIFNELLDSEDDEEMGDIDEEPISQLPHNS